MQRAFSFDKDTIIKILKGACIAGGGALVIYVLQALTQLDFGVLTPTVVAIAGILINVVKEFIAGK